MYMSQHILETKDSLGNEVEVQLGWDLPLNRYYLVISKPEVELTDKDFEKMENGEFTSELEEEDEYIYSNLSDSYLLNNRHLYNTVTYFKEKAKQLGIIIPDKMWDAAILDSRNTIQNNFEWNTDGTIKK